MGINGRSLATTVESEMRSFKREPFYPEDMVFLEVSQFPDGKIIDLNFTGALVEYKLPLPNGRNFEKGQKLENCIIRSNKLLLSTYSSAMVCHTAKNSVSIKVGIVFSDDRKEISNSDESSRNSSRLPLNRKFLAQGSFENPIKLNESITFQILDISKSGARFQTSARNRMLMRGLDVENAFIFFPNVGTLKFNFKIKWTKKMSGIDAIEGGLVFTETEPSFESALSKYLLCFADVSANEVIKNILDTKLKIRKVKSAVNFQICTSAEDYEGVLALRKDAYARAGKVAMETPTSEMADKYDSHSRIVVAKFNGQVVGSIRFTFCGNEDQTFELEESIELPKKFVKNKTVEASRACINSSFENSDLIHGLFEVGAQICLKMKTKWVITSCDEKLFSLYQKLGFAKQGIEFKLKTLGGIPHSFIAASMKTIYTSSGLNPAIWHFSFRPVANYMHKLGYIQKPKMSIFRGIFYSILKFLFLREK